MRHEAKLLPTARATRGFKFWGVSKNSERYGFFSYLFYSLDKGHVNGWGFVEAWMVVVSVSKDLDRVKKSLEWFWTVHGLLCM